MMMYMHEWKGFYHVLVLLGPHFSIEFTLYELNSKIQRAIINGDIFITFRLKRVIMNSNLPDKL